MAVYTEVSSSELEAALAAYNMVLVGEPRPVADGIENTTYFFSARTDNAETREFVLTVIESCPSNQLDYTTALTRHLASKGLPVPAPLTARNQSSDFSIKGRPALIYPRAKGRHPESPSAANCAEIGDFLARLHRASSGFSRVLNNTRGLRWLKQAHPRLAPVLTSDQLKLLDSNLQTYEKLCARAENLPSGAIHGDLFRDNALFHKDSLSAVIDFYNACSDWFILDVAITLNDWCVHWPAGVYDSEKTERFLSAYQAVRPFTAKELELWPQVLTLAANRFWVSRLLDAHSGRDVDETTRMKDPNEFLRLQLTISDQFPELPGSFSNSR